MEAYVYFDFAKEDTRVFHMMGKPDETKHLVVDNEQSSYFSKLVDSLWCRNEQLFIYLGNVWRKYHVYRYGYGTNGSVGNKRGRIKNGIYNGYVSFRWKSSTQ